MSQTSHVVKIITLLSLALFGGTGVLFVYFSQTFVVACDIPINKELLWQPGTPQGSFAAVDPEGLAARVTTVHNGSFLSNLIVVERPNDFGIERVLVGQTDPAHELLKKKGINGVASASHIRVESLQMQPRSEMPLIFLSMSPDFPCTLAENTAVFCGARRVDEGHKLSDSELLLVVLISAAAGCLLYHPISALKLG